jgi:hypothetical protein
MPGPFPATGHDLPNTVGVSSPGPIRFAATCLVLLLASAAAIAAAGAFFENATAWRAYQDPRQRILWDFDYDGSPFVLIGDSVFCSGYVDSAGETLWARLAAREQAKVFPAALWGATPSDMVLVAKRVAALWPPGTTAFIDIHPLRLFGPHMTGLPADSAYEDSLPPLTADDALASDPLAWADQRARLALFRQFFVVRNHRWISRYLRDLENGPGGQRYFQDGDKRNRVWSTSSDFALRHFRLIKRTLAEAPHDRDVPFGWIRSLNEALGRRGITAVFVLTPVNWSLVREYSPGSPPPDLKTVLVASHTYLVRELDRSGLAYIDMFDSLDSDSFADTIHSNTKGEEQTAQVLSDWLSRRPVDRRGAAASAPQPGTPTGR